MRERLTGEASFTEELAGAQRGDNRFLAFGGRHRELHLASQEKVHGIRRLSLHEDGVVRRRIPERSSPGDSGQERFPIDRRPFGRDAVGSAATAIYVLPHFQVQSEEHFVQVRHVADEPLQREREPLDERGHRHNLLVSGQIRMLVDVDDFQVVPALQVLLAHPLEILDRHASISASIG